MTTLKTETIIMKILGIETSCDDTAVAVIDASGAFGKEFTCTTLSNVRVSQTIHAQFGGVYPNLARGEHQKNLVPMLELALKESSLHTKETSPIDKEALETILAREPELAALLIPFLKTHAKPDIDAIAVTVGPGLEPALWVGINFAKALAASWNLPLIPTNHMEGHIVISMMEKGGMPYTEMPALALLISGGHTELIRMDDFGAYAYIGRTRDDAVGEAFDKVARMLNLPYPGGPHISRLAENARKKNLKSAHALPRAMLNSGDYDFSFAGLKTAVLRITEQNHSMNEDETAALAREFEDTATDILVKKTKDAAEEYGARALIVGGGVSANTHIRHALKGIADELHIPLLVCAKEDSTDNALMIALAGYFRALRNEYGNPNEMRAEGQLKLAA